jgi:hypothetical protein
MFLSLQNIQTGRTPVSQIFRSEISSRDVPFSAKYPVRKNFSQSNIQVRNIQPCSFHYKISSQEELQSVKISRSEISSRDVPFSAKYPVRKNSSHSKYSGQKYPASQDISSQ